MRLTSLDLGALRLYWLDGRGFRARVSALDDFPLDTIRNKREWLERASTGGWWVAFSHDVNAVAALLTSKGKVRDALEP